MLIRPGDKQLDAILGLSSDTEQSASTAPEEAPSFLSGLKQKASSIFGGEKSEPFQPTAEQAVSPSQFAVGKEIKRTPILGGALAAFGETKEEVAAANERKVGKRQILEDEGTPESVAKKLLPKTSPSGVALTFLSNVFENAIGEDVIVPVGKALTTEAQRADTMERLNQYASREGENFDRLPQWMQKTMESTGGTVEGVVNWFENLDPVTQEAFIDTSKGVEVLADVAGGGAAKTVAKEAGGEVIEQGGKAVAKGLNIADDVMDQGAAAVSKQIDDITTSLRSTKDTLVDKIPFDRQEKAASILTSLNKVDPSKQLKFKELSGGDDIGQFLLKRDIVAPPEKTVELLTERFDEVKNRLDDALAQVQGNYKPPVVKTVLDDMIEFYTATADRTGLNKTKRRLAKLEGEGLTLSEINNIKREFERKVKTGYLKENNAIKVERNTNLDSQLREFRDETAAAGGFSNIKELSKEIQLTKEAANEIGKKFAKQLANNQFSLTDNLLLVGGAVDPSSLAVLGLKKIGSMPAVQAKIVKALKNSDMSPLKNIDVVPKSIINMKNKQKQFQAYKEWLNESGWADIIRLTEGQDTIKLLPEGSAIQLPEFKPTSIEDIEAVRGTNQ